MRTTVTLDPDVAHQLKSLMRERDAGFKETLNEVLRRGMRTETVAPEPYEMPVFSSPIRRGGDLDKALSLAAAMEDEELLARLDKGK